nr:hypothetical protein [Candidatus Cloacimonadota bacterium]
MKYQKEIYIFFHIPKCAGTTLRKNLEFNYRSNEVLNIYAAYNPVFKTAAGTENFIKKIPSKKKTKIKIIYGHNVHF